jgi:hypothetical protein
MEPTFNPNASPKAIEAAKKLIERYNSITIEEIIDAKKESHSPARILTGYGSTSNCYLCVAVDKDCYKCIYSYCDYFFKRGCLMGVNMQTYDAIEYAKTPEELVAAFKNRAAHITKIVELIEKHQANGTANY